ncbi:hypothetical protein MHYP_G00005470 [Metynnis hypsauchen]
MMKDGIARSSRTLSAMASKIRNIWKCAISVGLKIGGEREFVVIDESHFHHKRKIRLQIQGFMDIVNYG